MDILIINGPNLDRLGERSPEIYGNQNFESFLDDLQRKYPQHSLTYFQSNIESELVNRLTSNILDAIILNAAAFTHSSKALAEAVSNSVSPVIEVHISNTLSREQFRHTSLIGPYCQGSIIGFGLKGYELAILSFITDKS